MKKTILENIRNSRWFKCSIVYFTALTLHVQGAMVAMATPLTVDSIESDFASNPLFELAINDAIYQHRSNDYMERSAVDAKNMESFYQELSSSVPTAVSGINMPRYVGTPLVESRYIRKQIHALLGRNLINADLAQFATEVAQLNTLYSNARWFLQNEQTNAKYGDVLDLDQESSGLQRDMVWPEFRVIQGERVVVPVVYLTNDTVTERRVTDHQTEFNGTSVFNELFIENVNVQFGRNAFLQVAGDLRNNGGSINGVGDLEIVSGGNVQNLSGIVAANGDLTINAQGNVDNISGVIKSGDNLIIGANSINNETVVHRYDFGYRQGGSFGEVSRLDSANGDIILRAYDNILVQGGILNAPSGDIRLASNGSIYVGPVQYTDHFEGRNTQRTRTQILQSYFTAEQNIELFAGGSILIDAAEFTSDQGHIDLLAQMGITIEDELRQSSYNGTWRGGDKTISSYKSVAMRSILDAGLGVRIHSDFGDITMRAADIRTTEGTAVNAANGSVNLLITKETDHYSYSEVKESLFTVTTINRGHNIETAIQNEIVGGFSVQALNSINVEYEGVVDGDFNDQINAFRDIDGLSWLVDLRDDQSLDIDWTEVETVYDEWNRRNTSLSPAAMAFIAVVVAVATQGAGAALVGSSAGATTTAVAQAAITSIANIAVTASANSLLNGANPFEALGDAFEAVFSTEGLIRVATSVVTAWAIAQIDADFFTEISPEQVDSSLLFDAVDSLSLEGQLLQAITHSAVRSGISTIAVGGDFTDFSDAFVQSLAQNAVNNLGRHMAEKIGAAFDSPDASNLDTALRYIAHAGAGCIIGAANAAIINSDSSENCAAGAGGAFVGELIADVHKSQAEISEDVEKLERFMHKYGLRNKSELDNLTPEQLNELKNINVFEAQDDLNQLMRDGIPLVRLGVALTAFVAGANADQINTAVNTGVNAAENNALFLIPIAILLLKAADIALTVHEYYTLSTKLDQATTEEERMIILRDHFGEKLAEAALEQIAKKLIPGLTTFETLLEIAGRKIKKWTTRDIRGIKLPEPPKCFVAGTLIHTAEGMKPIEQIRVGDLVLSRDEFTLETKYKRVTRLFENKNQPVIDITLIDKNNQSESLGVTFEHPLRLAANTWKKAGLLGIGDQIIDDDGEVLTVGKVSQRRGVYTTYNFEVEDFNTYFVGKFGAWAHNSCNLDDLISNGGKQINDDIIIGAYGNKFVRQTDGTYLNVGPAKVKRVQSGGGCGGQSNCLNVTLEADTHYIVSSKRNGSNSEYIYTTDANGRVESVSGDLDLEPGFRSSYQQRQAGSDGFPSDEGGHLIGTQFDGPGDGINLVPQNWELNRGAGSPWRAMESAWADALSDTPPKSVTVNMRLEYPSSGSNLPNRPDRFVVEWEIDGQKFSEIFRNQAGG